MKRFGVNFLILGFTLTILGILLEVGTRILISPEKEIGKDWVRQFIQYNRDGFGTGSMSQPSHATNFEFWPLGTLKRLVMESIDLKTRFPNDWKTC